MSYGKGLHKPDPAKSAHRLHASQHPNIFGTPRGGAMLPEVPQLDQGGSGTCHGHSAAGFIWTAFAARGRSLSYIPSPRLIAACTYADVQGPADKRGPLQDTGADLSDDSKAIATWGIAPMRGPTSDGRNSDVENVGPDGVFPEPDASQIALAGSTFISGEYSIPVNQEAPTLCALSLDAGIPVWLGFYCDSKFERLGPADIAQAPDQGDPSGGGHAIYISGYRTASDGSFQWRIKNSWGAWADNGGVWCSTEWLLACWILWPGAVTI